MTGAVGKTVYSLIYKLSTYSCFILEVHTTEVTTVSNLGLLGTVQYCYLQTVIQQGVVLFL
jgi:hypothetical protein